MIHFPLRLARSPVTILAVLVFMGVVSLAYMSRLYDGPGSNSIFNHIVRPFGVSEIPSWAYVEVVDDEPSTLDESTLWPYRVFKSAPWHPPYLELRIHENTTQVDSGLLFFNPSNRSMKCVKQHAPFIMDPVQNELVYGFDQPKGTINFRKQDLGGKPHATFWRGETVLGHGYGEIVILDETYKETIVKLDEAVGIEKNIKPEIEIPGHADFHEHHTTPRDSVLVTAYNSTRADLTSVGGRPHSWLTDSQFHEIDVRTNEVLFSWSAIDHIPLEATQLDIASYMGNGTRARPFDHFHINSIQPTGKNYLINSRHMHALYLIDGEDGHIIWEFSGRGSGGDFGPVPEEARFRWAHHARAWNVTENGMRVSLFDNHMTKEDMTETGSRGLVFELSFPPDRNVAPKLLNKLVIPDEELFANSQGSYQANLASGNQLMAYGPIPVIREFGPASEGSPLLWQARFGWDNGVQNYRAGKYDWHATPADWDPSLVVEAEEGEGEDNGKLRGYVSWNGATDVAFWNVYAVPKEENELSESKKLVGRAPRKGFETVFDVAGEGRECLQIGAVQDGKEVRMSNKAYRLTRFPVYDWYDPDPEVAKFGAKTGLIIGLCSAYKTFVRRSPKDNVECWEWSILGLHSHSLINAPDLEAGDPGLEDELDPEDLRAFAAGSDSGACTWSLNGRIVGKLTSGLTAAKQKERATQKEKTDDPTQQHAGSGNSTIFYNHTFMTSIEALRRDIAACGFPTEPL